MSELAVTDFNDFFISADVNEPEKPAGKVKDKKLIPESFNYNYKVKDTENGMSKRIYGTVRAKH